MSTSTVRVGDREIEIRELADGEHVKLLSVPPFKEHGLPALKHMRAIAALEGGKVVAYWMVFDAVHVEPLWIAEDLRSHPGVGRRLWSQVQQLLCSVKVPRAFAMIHDEQAAMNVPMAMRMGFRRLPGDLYFIDVTQMQGAGNGNG